MAKGRENRRQELIEVHFVIYLALPKVPHPKYTGYLSSMQGNV